MLKRMTSPGACVLLLVGSWLAMPSAVAAQMDTAARSAAMVAAAEAFVATLEGEAREKAVFEFEDDERFNWFFIPRAREGLPLQDMNLAQRRAAHDLMRSVLSSRGYLKATSIIQLELVLRALQPDGPFDRNPELYYFTIFGTPSLEEPWGWRVEGHHLSLNYTSVSDELTAVTPAFMGANPAEVRDGPLAGLRVLGAEEDLGRALISMLDDGQLEAAIISETAPNDIITGNSREAMLESFDGLSASEMSEGQRAMLMLIVEEYAHNMRPELAEGHLARIRGAGIENLHFAWAGSVERDAPHYYRIHGPNVLFEYDNVQGGANHIHSVWRDLENDFGGDMLRRHYEDHPHPHDH